MTTEARKMKDNGDEKLYHMIGRIEGKLEAFAKAVDSSFRRIEALEKEIGEMKAATARNTAIAGIVATIIASLLATALSGGWLS